MNHPPETHAGGDYNPSPPQPIASIVDHVHHPYHAPNGSPEKAPSTSSSDSDDDDFFHIEAAELRIPPAAKPPTAPVSLDPNVVSAGVSGGGGRENWKPPPPPPARYDVPDPSRIPPSIFARNAATSPMEWSVASNESLFSIQMGNSSFSREQGMFLIGRSGDLGNFMSGPLEYPPLRPPAETVAAGKGRLVDVNEMEEEEEEEEGFKVVMVEGKEKEKKSVATEAIGHSISRHSDGSSTTSIRSFVFPLLTGEGINGSIKVAPEHHVEHQPPPLIKAPNATTSKPAGDGTDPLTPVQASAKSRWFPCFSWCSICC